MPYNARLILFDSKTRCYLTHNTPDNPGHNLTHGQYLERVMPLIPQPYLFPVLWYERLLTLAEIDKEAPQTVKIRQWEISDSLDELKPVEVLTMCPLETTIFQYETGLWLDAIDGANSLEEAMDRYMRKPGIRKLRKQANLENVE